MAGVKGMFSPRYEAHEDEYIRKNYGVIRTCEIAFELGREPCSIQQRAKKLGVSFGPRRRIKPRREGI